MNKPLCAPCNIEKALEVVGDKWTALIINQLTGQPSCFSELEKRLDGISPRTLSQRLDKLESNQVISRSLYCERPPRYRYSLTPKGQELKSVVSKLAAWGGSYT